MSLTAELKAVADDLKGTLAKANQPASGTARVEGMLTEQAPPKYVKANLGTKPFSFVKLMMAVGDRDRSKYDVAPYEMGVLDQYKKAMSETHCGLENHHTYGTWFPMNLEETYGGRLTSTSSAEAAYRECKAVLEASRPAYDQDEANWLANRGFIKPGQTRYVKADGDPQSAYVDNIGGSLVAPPVQGPVIPLIRPQAAFLAAGAQAITLPPNGRWVAPRITSPPNVLAVGESQDTPGSQLGTGQMELTAKKIAGYVVLTEEGTAFTSGTLDAIAQAELGRSLGLKLDYYAFYGTGGSQIPAGLTSDEYASQIINIQTSYPACKGIGSNGNQLLPQYGDFFPALIAERSFNVDAAGGAWVMRPTAYATAMGLRGDAVAAGDQAGPMVDILRRFSDMSPTSWRGRRVVQTTNIVGNSTKNASGAVLGDVFFGIWAYAMFASYGAIQFQQGHDGNTFKRGQIIVRGTMYGDVGFQYPPAYLWYPFVEGMSNSF